MNAIMTTDDQQRGTQPGEEETQKAGSPPQEPQKLRKISKHYESLRERYSAQDLERATPFGRVVMQEMNRQRKTKRDLIRYLGFNKDRYNDMLINDNVTIPLETVYKVAEFLHIPVMELLLAGIGKQREQELQITVLLERFARIGSDDQRLLLEMAQLLVLRHANAEGEFSEDQLLLQQTLSRLILQPEHMRRPRPPAETWKWVPDTEESSDHEGKEEEERE